MRKGASAAFLKKLRKKYGLGEFKRSKGKSVRIKGKLKPMSRKKRRAGRKFINKLRAELDWKYSTKPGQLSTLKIH